MIATSRNRLARAAGIVILFLMALSVTFAMWLRAEFSGPASAWTQQPLLQKLHLALWGELQIRTEPLPARRDPASPLPLLRLQTPEEILWHERRNGIASLAEAGNYDFAGIPMEIMGRGNSTWTGRGKRPYQLRFNEPTDVLGMGEARKWVLLACALDKSLLRPLVAHRLSESLALAWTPDIRPVELEINGKYHGIYLLAEKVEPGESRLSLPEGAVLFHADARADKAASFVLRNGLRVAPDAPVWDEMTAEDRQRLEEALVAAETALYDGAPGEWMQYFELDALIDWFLAEEITNNLDSAMVASVYFMLTPEGKLRFGPVWDFDLSMANTGVQALPAFTGWATALNGRGWFAKLTQRPEFMELVRKRYTALVADGLYESIDTWITQSADLLRVPQKTNYQAWSITQDLPLEVRFTSESWEAHVGYVRDFFGKRRGWLDATLGLTAES